MQWRCHRCQYEYKPKQQIKLAQIFLIQQNGFTNKTKIKTEFKSMEANEMNKCLSCVSVMRKGSNFYKKTSCCRFERLSSRPPPPHNKKLSFRTTVDSFSEANKGLIKFVPEAAYLQGQFMKAR